MKTNQKTMSVIIECYANNYSLGGAGIRRTRNGVRYNIDLERSDVGTTQIYSHLSQNTLHESVNRVSI